MMAERREHQRFHLGGNCLIRHEDLVGTVINLSLGGLSCSCLSSDNLGCDNCFSRRSVDIFRTDNRMRVRGLTMEIVDSEKTPRKHLQNFWIRKCRARFDNLRKGQIALLENLIRTIALQNPDDLDNQEGPGRN